MATPTIINARIIQPNQEGLGNSPSVICASGLGVPAGRVPLGVSRLFVGLDMVIYHRGRKADVKLSQ
jgi:hypothetical protein